LIDDDAKLASFPALAVDGTPLVVSPTLCTFRAKVAVPYMSVVMTLKSLCFAVRG